MDQLVIFVSALILCTNAFKSDDILHPPPESNTNYNYAVDVDTLIDVKKFECLREWDISTVFVRAYKPDGGGSVDQNAISNIKNLTSYNFGVEIYVESPIVWREYRPFPKPGDQQFEELYTFLANNSIDVRAVWLKVTSPFFWNYHTEIDNIEFIRQFTETAQRQNVSVGVFTNWYDWGEITGGWSNSTFQDDLRLWYWNMNGIGMKVASPPSMNDFKPFNGFKQPLVKQYAGNVPICGITANLNSYTTNFLIPKLSITNGHQNIAVGFIGIQ